MIGEYRLVLVEWADAEGGVRSGWRPIEDMAHDTVPCYSVGWLTRTQADTLVSDLVDALSSGGKQRYAWNTPRLVGGER